MLIAVRGMARKPIDPVIAGVIRFHILRVKDHWNESLRYEHLQAQDQELTDVFESVDWLLANHTSMWS